MDRLEGCAWRDRDGTHVQLAGLLAKNSERAMIVDVYPCGEIKYENDPDCAEVFIDEWRKEGVQPDQEYLRWQDCVLIATQKHQRAKIYINGEEELELVIKVSCEDGAKILRWGSLRQVELRGDATGII